MPTYRAVQVAAVDAPLTLVEVDTSQPGPGQVRIAVAACGADHGFVAGGFPNMTWPLTMGQPWKPAAPATAWS